jgi:hypothetical protein
MRQVVYDSDRLVASRNNFLETVALHYDDCSDVNQVAAGPLEFLGSTGYTLTIELPIL